MSGWRPFQNGWVFPDAEDSPCDTLPSVKHRIAKTAALFSGLYLLVAGPFPDPLPLIDEGIMMMIFLTSMKALGKDGNWWLPLFGRKAASGTSGFGTKARDATIDV